MSGVCFCPGAATRCCEAISSVSSLLPPASLAHGVVGGRSSVTSALRMSRRRPSGATALLLTYDVQHIRYGAQRKWHTRADGTSRLGRHVVLAAVQDSDRKSVV